MTINNIKQIVMAVIVGCGAAAVITGCSDEWDDHYVDTPLVGANQGNLWQVISKKDGDLTNFARVIEACGYDKALMSSQMFTVFAPVNANFTSEQADSVINLYNSEVAAATRTADNRAIKEFVQNHIARYTYSVASTTSDSIVMMNGKYLMLKEGTFGSENLLSSNNLYENGVLFNIEKPVTYHPNIFEYVRTDSALTKLAGFLYDSHFFRYELNESQSVPGGIEDGRTVYLDSVMVKENELFYQLGQIDREDSSYVMLAPTDDRWDEMVAAYTPYFNYCDDVDKRDSLVWAMPRFAIVEGTVFSQTMNAPLRNHLADSSVKVDSVMSTNAVKYDYRCYFWGHDSLAYYQYYKPFETDGAFDGVEDILCSNGHVFKADKWNVLPTQTFMHELRIEAEDAKTIIDETTTRKRLSTVNVQSSNPFYGKVSGNKFLEIQPKNGRADNPIISFEIPNVLSNVPYDIYVVTAPVEAADTAVDESQIRPTIVHVCCFYKEQDGTGVDVRKLAPGDDKLFKYELAGRGEYPGFYESNATKVDTICVGTNVVFPTCSYGLSEAQVHLYLGSDIGEDEGDLYSRVLRIDCIIFKPRMKAAEDN